MTTTTKSSPISESRYAKRTCLFCGAEIASPLKIGRRIYKFCCEVHREAWIKSKYSAIESATTVQEVRSMLDLLEAARGIAARHKGAAEEIRLKIAESLIRAEYRLGELLSAAKAAGLTN